MILPKCAGRRYPFQTIEQMLDTFAKRNFRLGVIAGYLYADARVNAFIADAANKDQIVAVASDDDNLRKLLTAWSTAFSPIGLRRTPRSGATNRAPASKNILYASRQTSIFF